MMGKKWHFHRYEFNQAVVEIIVPETFTKKYSSLPLHYQKNLSMYKKRDAMPSF
jgi:hypothetical protein